MQYKILESNLTVLVTKSIPTRIVPNRRGQMLAISMDPRDTLMGPSIRLSEMVQNAYSTIWLELLTYMQEQVRLFLINTTMENQYTRKLKDLYNTFLLIYYAAEYGQYRYEFSDRFDGSDDLLISSKKLDLLYKSGVKRKGSMDLFTLYDEARGTYETLQRMTQTRMETLAALVIEPYEEKQEKYDRLLAYIQSKHLWPKEVMSYAKASSIL
jgi:hypothetical protein